MRRAAENEEGCNGWKRSETAEESGEGASKAEGPGGDVKDTWIRCVPMVHSRCKVASSRSIRRGILSSCRERNFMVSWSEFQGEKRKLLHTPAFERGRQKTQLFVIGEERLDVSHGLVYSIAHRRRGGGVRGHTQRRWRRQQRQRLRWWWLLLLLLLRVMNRNPWESTA